MQSDQILRKNIEKRICQTPFLGRKAELETLSRIWRDVAKSASRRPRMVVIEGEAGIGKTRLALAFARQVETESPSACVLFGPNPARISRPFGAFMPLISDILHLSPKNTLADVEKALAQRLGGHLTTEQIHKTAPILAFLLGFPIEDVRLNLEPPSLFPHLIRAIHLVLTQYTQERPTVLIIDDSQWLDEASLTLLAELSHNPTETEIKPTSKRFSPALVLLLTRPDSDLSDGWPSDDAITRLTLAALSAEASHALWHHCHNRPTKDIGSDQSLATTTRGHPFFIQQCALWINERSPHGQDLQALQQNAPSDLAACIKRRLDSLPKTTRTVAEKAAVWPLPFQAADLKQIFKRSRADFPQHLTYLIENGWLVEVDAERYDFTHPYLRELVYDQIPDNEKTILHRDVANHLAEAGWDLTGSLLPTLARYYQRSEQTDPAIRYLAQSGDHFLRCNCRKHAIQQYEALIALDRDLLGELRDRPSNQDRPDPQELIENYLHAHLQLGYTLFLDNQWKESTRHFNYALSLADRINRPEAQAEACRRIGRIKMHQGEHEAAGELFRRCVELLEPTGNQQALARAWASLGMYHKQNGDYQEALMCLEKDLALSQAAKDPSGIARAYGNLGNAYRLQGNFDAAMSCYQTSLDLAKQLGNLQNISMLTNNLALAHFERGEFDAALAFLQNVVQQKIEIGDRQGLAAAIGNMGQVHIQQRDYAAATKAYQRLLRVGNELQDLKSIAKANAHLGLIHYYQGDLDLALAYLRTSLGQFQKMNDRHNEATIFSNLGRVYFDLEMLEEARQHLQTAVAIGRELNVRFHLCSYLLNLAEVEFSTENYDSARHALSEARTFAEQVSRQTIIFETHLLQARLDFVQGDRQAAVQALSEMLQMSQMETEPDVSQRELEARLYAELAEFEAQVTRAEWAAWSASIDVPVGSMKAEALRRYEALNAEAPTFEYQRRIDRLAALP